MVGRKMYGGASTHIPLRVNTAGVIPIIFASSIMMLPAHARWIPPAEQSGAVIDRGLVPSHDVLYNVVYGAHHRLLHVLLHRGRPQPEGPRGEHAEVRRVHPGHPPGRKTAEYIDRVLSRITLPGAVFLALIAIVAGRDRDRLFNDCRSVFGGTSMLIVVGVALDTLQQIESHLLMRHYEGSSSAAAFAAGKGCRTCGWSCSDRPAWAREHRASGSRASAAGR